MRRIYASLDLIFTHIQLYIHDARAIIPFAASSLSDSGYRNLPETNTDAKMILSWHSFSTNSRFFLYTGSYVRNGIAPCIFDAPLMERHYTAGEPSNSLFPFQYRDRCCESNMRARLKRTRWSWCMSLRKVSTERTSGRNSVQVRTSKDRSRSPEIMSREIFRPLARLRLARAPTTTVSSAWWFAVPCTT